MGGFEIQLHVRGMLYGLGMIWTLLSCQPEKGVVVSQNLEVATPEQMRLIGSAFRQQIRRMPAEFPMLSRSQYEEAYAYMEQLLLMVVRTPQYQYRDYYEWSVDLIYDDSLAHAFILPGGHLFITTGLLRYIEDESQALALIAHELYYADREVAFEQLRAVTGGFLLGDIVLGNPVEGLDEAAQAAASISWPANAVVEADSVCVEVLCPFRYDAQALACLLEKMQQDEGQSLEWVRTHGPISKDRIDRIRQLATSCGYNGLTHAAAWQQFISSWLP